MTKLEEILNLKFYSKDLDKELTIKDFFKKLLVTLFKEKEMFDSKRPFGNSDWDDDLIVCLIKNNIIHGKLDEEGYIEFYDEVRYNLMLHILLENL